MRIVGNTLETGVRIDVSRPHDGGPPWRYEGTALTPDARCPLVAVVSADGEVSVEVPAGAPDVIAARARLLLRTAYKHAREDGLPPPRRIVRWRADIDLAPPRGDG